MLLAITETTGFASSGAFSAALGAISVQKMRQFRHRRLSGVRTARVIAGAHILSNTSATGVADC
jgi:hypothetical protein